MITLIMLGIALIVLVFMVGAALVAGLGYAAMALLGIAWSFSDNIPRIITIIILYGAPIGAVVAVIYYYFGWLPAQTRMLACAAIAVAHVVGIIWTLRRPVPAKPTR